MKKVKGLKNAHTPNTKRGLGDNYGSGVHNPLGKMREGMGMQVIKPAKLKKPPKTLA